MKHILSILPSRTNISQILTGATGSIGAHTLYELLNDASITTVYCLTRRSSPLEAIIRNLVEKDLLITAEQATRIVALNSSLDEPELGLGDEVLIHSMKESVTQIIHAAWPVNFNLALAQFEPHIRGLYNLIQFSLSVQRPAPATLIFCSSISTALASHLTEIQEGPMCLDSAYMGYGQSKLIGEHIVSVARATGARAFSLRIGQVSGHSKKGLWNDSEALPLLIRSALTLKALPEMDQTCSWLPVDKLASTIIELTKTCSTPDTKFTDGDTSRFTKISADDSIYNVCNSREFSWSALLASLARSGFQFEIVSLEKWLDMLRKSEARGEEHVNPAVKLIGHYEAMYEGKSSGSRLEPKVFATDKAERDSVTLRNDRLRIIEDGILNCYARDWLSRWMTP